ncbi:MAG: triose-phosphate isomerase [Actinomycetota bacterium]|nr:triose-phosphate isomerase [Actinomycetota bacterium]
MRKQFIAGNWKMNLNLSGGIKLVEELWSYIGDVKDVEIAVFPPYVLIPAISELKRKKKIDILLGAQNMHWENNGAFTGEVSPLMLKEFDVTHVILGHSERRQHFGETDQAVNRKVRAALECELVPILCVGESLKEREDGQTERKVVEQVKRGVFQIDRNSIGLLIIAYEPVWAIGTGKAATVTDASDVSRIIREAISEEYDDEIANGIRILYGGSVNSKNIAEFMGSPEIDGAVVGGASLDAFEFSKIVRYT